MRNTFIGLALLLACVFQVCAQDTAQHVVRGRMNSNAQQKKPYVILISVDGLRYDMAEKFGAKNLLRLSRRGVTTEYMSASFPSLTFPNHYTIVTGMYPSHHGLVSNRFYDREKNAVFSMHDRSIVEDSSWYGGVPLWVLAERQQMVSASYFWVGSEAPVDGYFPTYYYQYNTKRSMGGRISTVKDWLQLPEEKRPHLITFYFSEVDHAAHNHGPNSPEAAKAVRLVDRAIGRMAAMVDSLGLQVNFIVVSDHGMLDIDHSQLIRQPDAIDTADYRMTIEGALVHLYAKPGVNVKNTYQKLKASAKGYDVFLRDEMPAHWHYGRKDDRHGRIGDIVLLAKPPAYFQFAKGISKDSGKHGYDPAIKEMRASFYAWGPAFKQVKVAPFENVHVYPLVAYILGLEYSFSIDGKLEVLNQVLKNPQTKR